MRQVFFLFLSVIVLNGCGPGSDQDNSGPMNGVIARVNNATITQEQFNALIRFEASVDPEFDLTVEKKKEFLDYLIQKELFINEASKLKLDQKEQFVRTIEKYWESTLIRTLIDNKTEEFKKKVLITEDEIAAYYKNNEMEFNVPLPQARERIKSFLENQKVSMMVERWTEQLKDSSTIVINRELLDTPM